MLKLNLEGCHDNNIFVVVVGCNNPHHDLRSELAHLGAFISQLNEESKQVFFSNFSGSHSSGLQNCERQGLKMIFLRKLELV